MRTDKQMAEIESAMVVYFMENPQASPISASKRYETSEGFARKCQRMAAIKMKEGRLYLPENQRMNVTDSKKYILQGLATAQYALSNGEPYENVVSMLSMIKKKVIEL